jgi:thiamine-monophosphate kinase
VFEVSDGLIVDSAKLALNSNCSLNINSKAIPISIKAKKLIKKKILSLYDLIGAGDDYELAFSINEKNLNVIRKIATKKKVKISVIGKFSKGKKILLDNKFFSKGYSHF